MRDPETFLISTEEKKRYQSHNNSIENQGYVKFLSPVIEIARPHLPTKAKGLDYGSGPGPIMDLLFAVHNIEVTNYDPYFTTDPNVLNEAYDFVTCTEVFEHFYQPNKEINQISKIIKEAGYLILMTELRKDLEHFKSWSYRTDNTHVCFLNPKSLNFICENWGYQCLSSSHRLHFLQK